MRNWDEEAFSETDLLDLDTIASSETNFDYSATEIVNCSLEIKQVRYLNRVIHMKRTVP